MRMYSQFCVRICAILPNPFDVNDEDSGLSRFRLVAFIRIMNKSCLAGVFSSYFGCRISVLCLSGNSSTPHPYSHRTAPEAHNNDQYFYFIRPICVGNRQRSLRSMMMFFRYLSLFSKRLSNSFCFPSLVQSVDDLDDDYDPTSIKPQSDNDIKLLWRVLDAIGKKEEALFLLGDESSTGLRSKLGKGVWWMAFERPKMAMKMNDYEHVWKFCYQVSPGSVISGIIKHKHPHPIVSAPRGS